MLDRLRIFEGADQIELYAQAPRVSMMRRAIAVLRGFFR